MALVVNTNMNALMIENTLTGTNNSVSSSLQKLSSGLRINSAKDNPAGYAIANSFKASIASMQVASQNAGEAQSMLQTADGAYTQINNILVQMKSLATEAASGQTNQSDLTGEFKALQDEIDTHRQFHTVWNDNPYFRHRRRVDRDHFPGRRNQCHK